MAPFESVSIFNGITPKEAVSPASEFHFRNRRRNTPPMMIKPDPSKAKLTGSGVGKVSLSAWTIFCNLGFSFLAAANLNSTTMES